MAQRISDVGELGLISRIERLAARVAGRSVRIGIGDDAALLRLRKGQELAVSCDALVEGVHFRFDHETARTAGRRALAAALSDLAATGASPLGFTCALALPPSTPLARVLDLVRGMLDRAAAERCPLVGGNVTRAREISLNLTVLGGVARGAALTRSGARLGHRLFVTGQLGSAALARARGRVRGASQSRIRAGRALGRVPASACIDLSDGLLADLGHLCRASGVGAELEANLVPRPRGFDAACRRLGLDASRLLLAGGEDYELLFTLSPAGPSEAALSRRLGAPVTRIGRITRGSITVRPEPPNSPGWRHF